MEIEAAVLAIIAVFGVLLVILAFGDLYSGEWQTVAQNVSLVAIGIVVFAACMGGIAYWQK